MSTNHPDDVQGEEAPPEPVATTEAASRDAANWAKQVSKLKVGEVPPEALNRNVEGRRVVGPIQGFGKLWQKTYRIDLGSDTVSPTELIATWKEHFPKFWPERNWFYGPLTGIAPGEVAVLNLTMPGRVKLSTGVLVMYADEESFTFMTPQGHIFAGWITFSAYEKEGRTVAQVQVLMRAQDPLSEVGLTLGGHKQENKFWAQTLRALAEHVGAEGEVETQVACVDGKRQWKKAGNVWHSAAIRSGMYAMSAPIRLVGRPFKARAGAGEEQS